MNRNLFDFEVPEWFPVQDKLILEYCRSIRREDMETTNENGYSIRIIPHPESAIAAELFDWIWRSDVEDKKTVIVFPNSWRNVYTAAIGLCNKFNVNARNLYCFCMDEYASEDGRVAPISWERSLGSHFLREFYLSFREDLRPPLSHINYYTNENIAHYSDMIDECGGGGADLIISATGWAGHTAFIDPGSPSFEAETLEEFMQIPAGFVKNVRLTVTQNSTGNGNIWKTPGFSVSIGPRDVVHARHHLERHDLGFCMGPAMYSSWERMISRLQLYGPVCKEVPASLYQLTPGTIYVSEEMARPIAPMELREF